MGAPKKEKLKEVLAEFRTALQEEIKAVEAKGQSTISLFHGEGIASNSGQFWYRFHADKTPMVPADTPCKLDLGGKRFDVFVVKTDETEIILASNVPLPEVMQQAKLETGATILMERLIQCIEENAEKDNPTGNRMLPPDGKEVESQILFDDIDIFTEQSNTKQQTKAVHSALTRDITFIWGPPGTGKTSVIGQIIMELFRHDRSVLIVSHTNIAVDGAIEKVDKKYLSTYGNKEKEYPILRLGIPAKLSEEAMSRVSMDAHTKALGEELQEEKAALEKLQGMVSQRLSTVSSLLAKNTWKNESQLSEIKAAIDEMERLEKQFSDCDQEHKRQMATMEEEKTAHPYYAQYPSLVNTYRRKKKECDGITIRLEKLKKELEILPASIIAAVDEIKKHSIYAELKQQEEAMMSQQFLQEEIRKADQKKKDLHDSIDSLRKDRAAFQQTVDAYEKKKGLGRLFANKDAALHAKNRIDQIDKQLKAAREDEKRQEILKQGYEEQIEKLLMLKEQISHVMPTHTREYWENERLKRQSRLTEAEAALPQLQKMADDIAEELSHIIARASAAKNAYNRVREMDSKIRELQESIKQLQLLIAHKKEENDKRIAEEKKLCAVFYYTDHSEPKVLIAELSDLMPRVQSELAAYDIPELEKEKETKEKELSDILEQLNDVLRKLSELEKQVILDAKIIGATLAKSYISEALRSRTFDTVILDEASMASIPALWCTSYLAEKNIVIVGDFLQLPPIVVADEKKEMAQKWLGKDIFYHSGMQQRLKTDSKNPPECFVMLNDQFRMEKEIAAVANMYYGEYGGLNTPNDTDRRIKDREEFYSWYTGNRTKHCIHLIDTSASKAWVTGIQQGKSHSRMNCLSAIMDVDLAFMCLENKLANHPDEEEQEASVLIVAPYKPQIKQINQLIQVEYRKRGFTKDLGLIKAGTIHSFQGNEAEIVIFDLVIDLPHFKAKLFMKGDAINSDLEKMFNVAVTRAKFKLFMIGNFPYCMKKAKGNALSTLLDQLLNHMGLNTISVYQIFADHLYTNNSSHVTEKSSNTQHIICTNYTFIDCFQEDLHLFRHQCIIFSPVLDEASVNDLLIDFSLCKDNGKQIILVTLPTRFCSHY